MSLLTNTHYCLLTSEIPLQAMTEPERQREAIAMLEDWEIVEWSTLSEWHREKKQAFVLWDERII